MPGSGHGSEWRRRYAARGITLREQRARQAVGTGAIDWDPAGPYGPGIDGATYTPGWVEDGQGMQAGAVLLVRTRAMTELIGGWESYGQMQDWLASRGTTGSGRLAAPPAVRRARCVLEEAVLSHLLGRMQDAAAIGRYLPPQTWTSDVRHDVAMAILAVARTGRRALAAEQVAGALEERAASIPAGQLRVYGGRGLRWAMTYLARLDETPADASAAGAAAVALRSEDVQATVRARRRSVPGPRRAVAVAVPPRRAAAPEFRPPGPRY